MPNLTESSIRVICLTLALITCLSVNYANGWDTKTDLWTMGMMIGNALLVEFGISKLLPRTK